MMSWSFLPILLIPGLLITMVVFMLTYIQSDLPPVLQPAADPNASDEDEGGEDDEDDGSIFFDDDFPLDLPPGVYLMPPVPQPA